MTVHAITRCAKLDATAKMHVACARTHFGEECFPQLRQVVVSPTRRPGTEGSPWQGLESHYKSTFSTQKGTMILTRVFGLTLLYSNLNGKQLRMHYIRNQIVSPRLISG